jgi:TnpA family transposase
MIYWHLDKKACCIYSQLKSWDSGKSGEFASNRREDQELSMLSLHLLQISRTR